MSARTGAEITPETVHFNHHIVQTPKITQVDRIHKSTTELTKTIINNPSKNTLKHVNAIIKLRMLLQERKENRQKWPAEPEAIKIYARQPNITSVGAANSEGANKVPPTSHLATISQGDKNDNPHTDPTLSHPRCYLCSHVPHVAASVIIEEPHHVKTFTGPLKFGDPPLSNTSTFETNNQPQSYVPPNYMYDNIDPDSGK